MRDAALVTILSDDLPTGIDADTNGGPTRRHCARNIDRGEDIVGQEEHVKNTICILKVSQDIP